MAETDIAWPRLGATARATGDVEVHVWAPAVDTLSLRVAGAEQPLHRGAGGVFDGVVDAPPGCDYVCVLDGREAHPDPCSRSQRHGVLGPSQIVDPAAFRWTDDDWSGLSLRDLVIYELHVGAFSDSGDFEGITTELPRLRASGVTAVELMPIATFPGERNWGYDGLYTYAPHPAYGGPNGFATFVDAAHRQGIGIIVDVVYNHIGPGSRAISAFGPYVTDRFETSWGPALDYGERGVREWAIQNAEMWVRDYHVDGLRLDASHAIHDDSSPHVLAELAARVREIAPHVLVTSEAETGDLRPIECWGHDAQWADEFHHVLHVLLSGERDGYYEGYRPSVSDLAAQLRRTPAERLIFCSQNHDHVGNRPRGDRPRAAELAIRAAALLFAPQTPLLFMGEEYGERTPFQFFTNHRDEAIAEATREGRRRDFVDFAAWSGRRVPDPEDPATFQRSRLRRGNRDAELAALYRSLLELRRELPLEVEVDPDEEAGVLKVRRGHVELVLNFSDDEQQGVAARTAELRPAAS